ncbi:MAG: hypothetical protein GY842_10855 [bacterium]|nr:hypothetical protein [bacterium]
MLDFVPSVFFKVLTVAVAVAVVGVAISIRVYGSITVRDTVGTLICIPLAAYLVHLWIVYARDRYPDE